MKYLIIAILLLPILAFAQNTNIVATTITAKDSASISGRWLSNVDFDLWDEAADFELDTTIYHSTSYYDLRYAFKIHTHTQNQIAELADSLLSKPTFAQGDARYYPRNTNPAGYLVTADIAGKLNISDTAAMLLPYLRSIPQWVLDSFLTKPTFAQGNARYYPLTTNPSNYLVLITGDDLDNVFSSDGLLKKTGAGAYTTVADNSGNWDNAYGWGNHASAGYELQSNKSDNTALGTSTSLYPTQNAVKSYVDAAISGVTPAPQDLQSVLETGNEADKDIVLKYDGKQQIVIHPGSPSIMTIRAGDEDNNLATLSGSSDGKEYGYVVLGRQQPDDSYASVQILPNYITENYQAFLPDKSGDQTFAMLSDIPSGYQPLDDDLTAIAGLTPTNDDILQYKSGTWANRTLAQLKTDLNLSATYQLLISGTGIVKSTSGTISYLTDNSGNWNTAYSWGNHASAGYLTSAFAASTYQPLNTHLTSISGLTPTNNDILQYKSGAWQNRTPAQLKADLSLVPADVGLGNNLTAGYGLVYNSGSIYNGSAAITARIDTTLLATRAWRDKGIDSMKIVNAATYAPIAGITKTNLAASAGVPYILAQSGVASSTSSSTSEVNLVSILVPAGTLNANGRLSIVVLWKFTGTAGAKSQRVRLHTSTGTGGTAYTLQSTAASSLSGRTITDVWNANSVSSQVGGGTGLLNYGGGTDPIVTSSINTANDFYININTTVAGGGSGDVAQVLAYTVEVFNP